MALCSGRSAAVGLPLFEYQPPYCRTVVHRRHSSPLLLPTPRALQNSPLTALRYSQTILSHSRMDGAWSVVYLPRVLLDVVDQEWREDTLEDDGQRAHVHATLSMAVTVRFQPAAIHLPLCISAAVSLLRAGHWHRRA